MARLRPATCRPDSREASSRLQQPTATARPGSHAQPTWNDIHSRSTPESASPGDFSEARGRWRHWPLSSSVGTSSLVARGPDDAPSGREPSVFPPRAGTEPHCRSNEHERIRRHRPRREGRNRGRRGGVRHRDPRRSDCRSRAWPRERRHAHRRNGPHRHPGRGGRALPPRPALPRRVGLRGRLLLRHPLRRRRRDHHRRPVRHPVPGREPALGGGRLPPARGRPSRRRLRLPPHRDRSEPPSLRPGAARPRP